MVRSGVRRTEGDTKGGSDPVRPPLVDPKVVGGWGESLQRRNIRKNNIIYHDSSN